MKKLTKKKHYCYNCQFRITSFIGNYVRGDIVIDECTATRMPLIDCNKRNKNGDCKYYKEIYDYDPMG